MWFGPPRCFTTASSCPWIGHPVSGLLYATIRPFETRSRYGSGALHLNLATHSNSPARSTKSTWSLALPLLVNIGFQVLFHSPPGVLFTFPSQYYFSIGHRVIFRLGGWSPLLPTGFLVSRGTPVLLALLRFRLRVSHTLRMAFPHHSANSTNALCSPLPRKYFYSRFGLLRVRSPLLAQSLLISFPHPT